MTTSTVLWVAPLFLATVMSGVVAGQPGSDQKGAFDFLLGKRWNVHNRVLKERLAGCSEWVEFEAVLEEGRHLAGGLGNIDSFKAVRAGQPFEGNSLRLYDRESDSWIIYWMDSRSGKLAEQVRGRFEGKRGEFYGEEVFQGKRVKLRFLWIINGPGEARWEQAYYDDSAGDWETNWIMEFRLSA